MKADSHSSSPLLQRVLFGAVIRGEVLSRRHLRFGDYVVSLTSPGWPRMPNGIACDVQARQDDRVSIGDGRLVVGRLVVGPGPEWNPVPDLERQELLLPTTEPSIHDLAGRGPGLTPAGDDVLAGYVAGLVLLHGQRARASRIAEDAARLTTAFSATLLRHAAAGEVPEPVHTLLLKGDARPLLGFGHSSGRAWLRGLESAGYALEFPRAWSA